MYQGIKGLRRGGRGLNDLVVVHHFRISITMAWLIK